MDEEKNLGLTTASLETIPRGGSPKDETPGLVLIYTRSFSELPTILALASRYTTIGRELENSLSVPESAVSRRHVQLERTLSATILTDLGSTNGTLVNGRRVQEAILEQGDIVRVGDSLFRYVSANIYGYGPYRISGEVVRPAHVFSHAPSRSLIGGYQLDALMERIDRVAATPLSAVIRGESGTGKELVARELHDRSGRSGPFQAINCAALPATLLESELFGYRKGAFSGAVQHKIGLIQAANGGTLFLDEIGDMPLKAQVTLLRVVQNREVLPIGATQAEKIDVRFVCATHRDLDACVMTGEFRGDLLARLREVELTLPALRDRLEDLYPLVRHFLSEAGQPSLTVSLPYLLALAHYDWPYNVRELESAVKLSLALRRSDSLELDLLPEKIQNVLNLHGETRNSAEPVRAKAAPTEPELRALLVKHSGNIAAVGREVGKKRMQVHRWAKKYGIDLQSYRIQ